MRRIVALVVVIGGLGLGLSAWLADRRRGTRFVNAVVNPLLLRRGLAAGRSELGVVEHVGRVSGTRRVAPVHPEPIDGGFRILVPLGLQSEWARNVLAAGHCRLQLHGQVHDLDEPVMVPAADAPNLPEPVRRVMSALGFSYLTLRTFATHPGELEAAPAAVEGEAARETEVAEPVASAP